MKTTDVIIAANTIWVAGNGGTHGSPVGPLLHHKPTPAALWLPPGKVRLRPQFAAIHGANP
jgi:hypothetical protein